MAISTEEVGRRFEWSPAAVAIWVFLALVVAYGLYGVYAWPRIDGGAQGERQAFRAMEDTAGTWSVQEAWQAVRTAPEQVSIDTKLSEQPFWFLFSGPQAGET